MLFEPEIHSLTAPHEEGAKCAQIAKEWLDKGLAKCHEIVHQDAKTKLWTLRPLKK